MRFNYKFLLTGAMALAAVVACQKEVSEEVADNPTYNKATGEVKVDFVMNVSSGNSVTKMTDANTQADIAQTFRGIEEAVLMSHKLGTANDGKHITSAVTADKLYGLATVLTAGYLDPDGTGSTPKSRRVLELSLPTESNVLLFWGKAIKTGDDSQQGSITYEVSKNLANTAFTLNRRIPSGTGAGTEEAYGQYQALMAAAVNKVVQTSASINVDFGTENYTGTLTWREYVNVTGTGATATFEKKTDSPINSAEEMSPLGEILGDAFITLNTIYPNEVRAGSGWAVAHMMGDLYSVINSVATSTPMSLNEAVAKEVAIAIKNNLQLFFENPESNPVWKSASSVKSQLSTVTATLVTGDLNNFPAIFKVPYGAAVLQYDITTNTYSYRNDIPTYSMSGTPGGTFNIMQYRYPAELCYFGNSPIRVTSDAHVTADYPDGVANWVDDASWAAGATGANSLAWTKNGHVLSSTRSVAMQDNINYGTALFKTTVRYGVATLKDNNAAIQHDRTGATEEDAEISASAGAFTWTGLLIGGQEETVGWNYIAKANTPTFSSFVYDSAIPNTAIPAYTAGGAKSDPNYTLLWDNWNPANKDAKQNVVYVALEFVNNTGKDFWGMNNLIRNGATFYITGKLDPDEGRSTTDRSDGVTWPTTGYAMPPYAADGSTIQQRRVFIQDYLTEANFVLGEDSLKYALVAVPDLRSTQLSLGLSVDLTWSAGLVFDDIVLGN